MVTMNRRCAFLSAVSKPKDRGFYHLLTVFVLFSLTALQWLAAWHITSVSLLRLAV